MSTVARPDPNPRGGGQLPNPNECNSTLTSGTSNIYPYPYIDINDRGHRFRSGSPLTNYPHATPSGRSGGQFSSQTRLNLSASVGGKCLN